MIHVTCAKLTLLDSIDAIRANGIKISMYDNIKPDMTRNIPLWKE
jgi:hypothetical protein